MGKIEYLAKPTKNSKNEQIEICEIYSGGNKGREEHVTEYQIKIFSFTDKGNLFVDELEWKGRKE